MDMKKPKYMEELLNTVFLCLSVSFILFGVLSFFGILKPKVTSMVQDQTLLGTGFLLAGILFLLVYISLKIVVARKNKLYSELFSNGNKIRGTVENVYLQKYTHYGNKCPYRILYTYTYLGRVYHHKSCLLWDKPDLAEGDPIMVYVNDDGKSVIKL